MRPGPQTPPTILLEKSFSSVQFSLGKVASSETEAAYLIHEELCLRIGPSMLVCPAPIELQIANNIFDLQEASSYYIRLQTFSFEQLLLLEQLGQLEFQRSCVNLCAQKELFFLFLNGNFAHHLNLDLTSFCTDFSL